MESKKSEAKILNEIFKLGIGALRLFRNNVGLAKLPDGSILKYGLCNGSSDAIGGYQITITPEMVGKKICVLTAIEAKSSSGKATSEQKSFIDFIVAFGGIAGIARSADDVKQIIAEYMNKLSS